MEYQIVCASSRCSLELGFFTNVEGIEMKEVCSILAPLEEATIMVSSDQAVISDTLPIIGLLEQTLLGLRDSEVTSKEEEDEKEEGLPFPNLHASLPLSNTAVGRDSLSKKEASSSTSVSILGKRMEKEEEEDEEE